jgi:hypothetical protein
MSEPTTESAANKIQRARRAGNKLKAALALSNPTGPATTAAGKAATAAAAAEAANVAGPSNIGTLVAVPQPANTRNGTNNRGYFKLKGVEILGDIESLLVDVKNLSPTFTTAEDTAKLNDIDTKLKSIISKVSKTRGEFFNKLKNRLGKFPVMTVYNSTGINGKNVKALNNNKFKIYVNLTKQNNFNNAGNSELIGQIIDPANPDMTMVKQPYPPIMQMDATLLSTDFYVDRHKKIQTSEEEKGAANAAKKQKNMNNYAKSINTLTKRIEALKTSVGTPAAAP